MVMMESVVVVMVMVLWVVLLVVEVVKYSVISTDGDHDAGGCYHRTLVVY